MLQHSIDSSRSTRRRPDAPAMPPPLNDAPPIAITHEIEHLIMQGAPVAVGVSGGKDSQAAALMTCRILDRLGHSGPRVLIHADLGSVEWADSRATCEALARHLAVELIVVRRRPGGLMQRWEDRWASSVRRYENLQTVTLVPCWSTPAMRFCTSDQKTAPIEAELKGRFKGLPIVNVTGVRRAESRRRALATTADLGRDGRIWTWRPILDWREDDVFAAIDAAGLAPHPAYRQFGMRRVSCRFCIMSSLPDLCAASRQPETHGLFREIVDLETRSSFAFQGQRWLGDIDPQLLSSEERDALAMAKERAATRLALERRIGKPMLYVKGWPVRMLTDSEADLSADVRSAMSALFGFRSGYLTRETIHARYAELMAARAERARLSRRGDRGGRNPADDGLR